MFWRPLTLTFLLQCVLCLHNVGAFLNPSSSHTSFWPRRAAQFCVPTKTTALNAGATDGRELPEPVRGLFPLWEQNFLQSFGLIDPDQAKVCDLPFLAQTVAERPKDYLQQLLTYYQNYGGIFKVCLGPKAFLIVSEPAIVRHIMAENPMKYDKGILADILAPIMGKGLIPADLKTWKLRRKAIVPGFHKAWLQQMMILFGHCSLQLCDHLHAQSISNATVNMEALYSSVALDVIGKAVFNYEFSSVRNQSPVIDAVYGLMQEAEHRSFFPLPYWEVPIVGHRFLGLGPLVSRQQTFQNNIGILNSCLNQLIQEALDTREEGDLEALQQRDYSRIGNPSLLRFLVDMRGEEATAQMLRDDLMTMLIAGHETTAALLTWATYCLLTHPDELRRAQAEIDAVLPGGRPATYDDIPRLQHTRNILAESLRLYPQPPILIRRALEEDTLPRAWNTDRPVRVFRGTDIFILIWNLHRSPQHWGPDAGEFRPGRWTEPRTNPDVPGWRGFDPAAGGGPAAAMYPNEVQSDYAFCPFGAGPRKCLGDQFAFIESVSILASVLSKFDLALTGDAADVGMDTGATIHTANGLWVRTTPRVPARSPAGAV